MVSALGAFELLQCVDVREGDEGFVEGAERVRVDEPRVAQPCDDVLQGPVSGPEGRARRRKQRDSAVDRAQGFDPPARPSGHGGVPPASLPEEGAQEGHLEEWQVARQRGDVFPPDGRCAGEEAREGPANSHPIPDDPGLAFQGKMGETPGEGRSRDDDHFGCDGTDRAHHPLHQGNVEEANEGLRPPHPTGCPARQDDRSPHIAPAGSESEGGL